MLLLGNYTGDYDLWSLYHKVTFDGENRIILVNYGETSLNVLTDIYSAWKEWSSLQDNAKYLQAFNPIGGDPVTGGGNLEPSFFLTNNWKVRTWEGSHSLLVIGNLFTEDGSSPFISTIFPHDISINLKVSNLIDRVDDINLNTETLPEAVWNQIVEQYGISGSIAEKIRKNLVK